MSRNLRLAREQGRGRLPVLSQLIWDVCTAKRHPLWEGTNIMSKTLLMGGLVVIIGGGGLVL